ncbi:hypothetical protein TIFTF001_002130 [Ficus carica]|uniref:Uncharacterized protein n=1 Tax=Ficus carica TaxID=3494 RepID=A0AA87ZKL0_FICCA|nr:hypothetical protein TIFTF001_002130 [Ficus carica]
MAHSSAKVSVQKQKKIGVRKKKTTAATGGGVGNRMVEEERARLLVLEDRLREFRSLLLRLQQSLDRVEHRLSAIEDCVKNIRTAHS